MGEIGNLGPQGSIIFGVFVGLASTSIQSLGLTLQRKSHLLEDEKSINDIRRPPYKRRRWQIGMGMFIFSNIVGSTIQITTLPLPVLSALQASGLVFNSICATLILKEPFTRYSLAGTILVSAGAVLIATFGAIGEPAHGLSELLQLFERTQFILWIIATAILVGGAVVGSRILKTWVNTPKTRLLRGMSYGFVSGILSAHSLLLAKSAVELVVRTIADHVNQFNQWQSWVILLGLIGLASGQLYYLHRGLKLCSTSVLYPFVFCIYNIIAILDGLIYFNQASQLSALHGVLVVIGTLILLSGVISLSWRLDPDTRAQAMDADLADLAYQLDSDASSISSLDSPTEQTALLSKLTSPPILHSAATLPAMHSSSPDLEAGQAGDGTVAPSGPKMQHHLYPTRRSVHWGTAEDPPAPSTSTTSPRRERDSLSPSATRLRSLSRRQALAEADAIWGELQDEPSPTPPLSGGSSAAAAGVGEDPHSPFHMRSRSRSLAVQESRPWRGMTPSPDLESPRGGRASPSLGSGRFSPGLQQGGLLRSGTGRSYRERRPRAPPGLRGYGGIGHTSTWSGTGTGGTGEGEGDGADARAGTEQSITHRVSRMWRTALDAVAETVAEPARRRSSRSRSRGRTTGGLGIFRDRGQDDAANDANGARYDNGNEGNGGGGGGGGGGGPAGEGTGGRGMAAPRV